MGVQPLKPTTHLIFWLCASAAFIATVLLFKPVLLPFVLGAAVAYLLNPVVNKLGGYGFARGPAALLILSSFLIIIFAFFGAVSPIVYRELVNFADDLPDYIEKIQGMLTPLSAMLDKYLGPSVNGNIEDVLKQHAGSAAKVANILVQKVAAGGQAVMDIISVAVFMPIVAYFMMKEWPRMTAWVRDLLPRHSEEVIMDLLKEIDQKISGFVRGQISVAVILGIAYAIALSVVGLKYGFMIGLMSGLLSIIPMVGSAVGLIVSILVAYFQAGEWTFVLLVGGIFVLGQVIEGNFLTPKLVGDSVGLHPLWVFFALLAGGSILGILGMFLAVPVAAVIGVLISFAIYKYKQSQYYNESKIEAKSDVVKAKPKPKTKSKKTPVKKKKDA